MRTEDLQDILALIEKPSNYLGSEINSIKKDPSRVKLFFALAFPELYEIGTSHFGLQILYHILNGHPEIAAERVFAPGLDMEAYLRLSGNSLVSLESHKPLNRFDIIGFSLLYELNFTNILTILDLAGIPFFANQRDWSDPLIVAGGPCTCNPEPIADFFDAIVVGDGEKVVMEMSRTWLNWKKDCNTDREALLKTWSSIKGVYIPSFFEPVFDKNGFQTLLARNPNGASTSKKITRAILESLDQGLFPDAPIVPFGRPVHDRLRLEVSRGCTRGCRFCQAGMIYRPVRERPVETLLSLSEVSLDATGYEDVSLLSLSTGDYGCIIPLMEHLMARCEPRHVAVSLPSIRAGTLTPNLMKLIKKVRKTGFTIAPEAGSQRLRNVINKNVTNEEIFNTVQDAFGLGWQVIKLYFMIGLPSENDNDLQSMVNLIRELRKIRGPHGRKGKLNISITTFIPKPHTPFQWVSQIPLYESKEKIRWLREKLRMSGIHFKWQNPEASILEGLWARGDRKLSRLLVAAYKLGCKFDGWSETFQYNLWERALSDAEVDIDFYTTRCRDTSEPLPWDRIDIKVTKDFLIQEWEKSISGQPTLDCRGGACNNCGVCDFDGVAPRVFSSVTNEIQDPPRGETILKPSYKKVQVSYSKQDQARYFGHLELVNIFLRALRRAEIPVKFSEGFHPMPRVSFDDPLPVGMEGTNESLYLTIPDNIQPWKIKKGLNAHLPGGLCVHACRLAPLRSAGNACRLATYQITIKDGFFDQKALNCFKASREFILTRKDRKGRLKEIDLKDMISEIDIIGPRRMRMTLKSKPGKTIRPFDVIRKIFNLPEEKIKQARIVKGLIPERSKAK